MSSEYLSSYLENSAPDIEEAVPELLEKVIFTKGGGELGFFFRQNGSCHYLLSGSTTRFVEAMQGSVGSYLYYLQKGKDDDKRTSENEAYFDAIVGGLMSAVSEMAKYSRKSWNSDVEYEDDFLYTHFILSYFFRRESAEKTDCTQILTNYEQVLDGDNDVRFDICRSFYDSDSVLFNDSFEQFLIEREEKMDQMIRREVIGEDIWS